MKTNIQIYELEYMILFGYIIISDFVCGQANKEKKLGG